MFVVLFSSRAPFARVNDFAFFLLVVFCGDCFDHCACVSLLLLRLKCGRCLHFYTVPYKEPIGKKSEREREREFTLERLLQ